jgi:WD40 repeat protein
MRTSGHKSVPLLRRVASFGFQFGQMSESGLRTQYQYVIKERDELQLQCDHLTRENLNLRKAVYELSCQLSSLTAHHYPANSAISNNSANSAYFSYNSNLQQFQFTQGSGGATTTAPPSAISSTYPLALIHGHDYNRDNRTLSFECELKGHNGAVYCVDITSDNRWIASGGFDKTIVIWKGTVPYKQESILLGHQQLVSGLCWGREPPIQSNSEKKKNDANILAPVLFSTSFDKTVPPPPPPPLLPSLSRSGC